MENKDNNSENKRRDLVKEILNRCSGNVNTSEAGESIRNVAEQLKYYQSQDIFGMPPKRVTWIYLQIKLFESVVSSFFDLLAYTFSLEDSLEKTIQEKDDCISQLAKINQELAIDNFLLKEHLAQSIDGYSTLHTLFEKKTVRQSTLFLTPKFKAA